MTFKMLGDQVIPINLIRNPASGFDFGTMSPTNSGPTTVGITGVILKRSRSRDNLKKMELLLRSDKDVPINEFDKLSISGEEWKMNPSSYNDGVFSFVEVVRQ